MHRPIKATSVLWMTATLLLAVVPSSSTAEILTQNNNRGSSSSLHKTWGKFIQRQSLISKLEPTSTAATLSNDTHRRCITSGGRLSKLPCFVRRLPPPPTTQQQSKSTTSQSMVDIEWSLATGQIITKIRGGAAAADDEYDTTDDESDGDEYDSEYEDEYDSEYDDETDNEEESSEQQTSEQQDDKIVSSLTSSSLQSSLRSKSSTSTTNNDEQQIQKYDDVLAPPAMQQLVISLGVMFLSQKIDILDTKTVRIARFAFVAYVVIMQVFLVYVRLRAKAIDDRTEITLSNPLATLVQGAAGGAAAGVGGGGGGNFMVKALTDQMLSSTTTIYEYDIAQAKKMNSGLLLPMVFLYFLHFKMKQVQPLLMQTATGVMNMIYSPLFQVYVLGRNLERPFKSPPGGNSVLDALQQGEEEDLEESSSGDGGDEKGVDDDVEEDDDVDDEEEESEESEEGESDEGEEESDGDESEYDTDEE